MAKTRVTEAVKAALESARESGEISFSTFPEVEIEVPRNKEHGDFSCNVALALAREAGMSPRKVAECIASRISGDGAPHATLIQKVDIAGPGFINFYLKPDWLHDTLVEIEARGEAYGRTEAAAGTRVLLEFVSANPNGPITVGSARGGVIGDTLARLYEMMGAEVAREYYVNDAANPRR